MKRKSFSKRDTWSSASDITWRFNNLSSNLNRLMILNTIWEKEAGRMCAHWNLDAVQGGVIYVKVKSSAAAQELSVRQTAMVRNLNKYFDSPWIQTIKKI
ncbi:MAG: DciA family protein [Elusimicrobiaceae bacterium]